MDSAVRGKPLTEAAVSGALLAHCAKPLEAIAPSEVANLLYALRITAPGVPVSELAREVVLRLSSDHGIEGEVFKGWVVSLASIHTQETLHEPWSGSASGSSNGRAIVDFGTFAGPLGDCHSPPASLGEASRSSRSQQSGGLSERLAALLRDYGEEIEGLEDDFSEAAVQRVDEWSAFVHRGIDGTIRSLVQAAARDPELPSHVLLRNIQTDAHNRYTRLESAETSQSCKESIGAGHTIRGGVRPTRLPVTPFASVMATQHLYRAPQSVWHIDAALLFIDISGYSRVATVLAEINPHELSRVVNAYFGELLTVVRRAGGDVVKFAGDAVLVVFHSQTASVPRLLRAAAACAMELVEHHGAFDVAPAGTFGIHIGLACGTVTSRIMLPPPGNNATAMPSAFHFVSGKPLADVAAACSLAQRGEVGVHASARDAMTAESPQYAVFGALRAARSQGREAEHVQLVDVLPMAGYEAAPRAASIRARDRDASVAPGRAAHFVKSAQRPSASSTAYLWCRRQGNLLASSVVPATSDTTSSLGVVTDEMLLVPPRVSEQLAIGVNPLLMAQMRDLIVLFVRMGDATDGSVRDPVVWFAEVHGILRDSGCAVVQVIDDDKGVHVVAAYNLYHMTQDAATRCVAAVAQLRKSLSYVGAAAGKVFCGVLGHPSACQWDITGEACVRACRLMQHGVACDAQVVLDPSVYHLLPDKSDVSVLHGGPVALKGAARPVQPYTLQTDGLLNSGSHLDAEWDMHAQRAELELSNSVRDVAWHSADFSSDSAPMSPMAGKLVSSAFETSGDAYTEYFAPFVRQPVCPLVHSAVVAAITGIVSGASSPAAGRRRTVIVRGPPSCGKFIAVVNALLSLQHYVPIVHCVDESMRSQSLAVLRTVAEAFVVEREHLHIRPLARRVLDHLVRGRRTAAFHSGRELVCLALQSRVRIVLVVRGLHYLDVESMSFLRALHDELGDRKRFALVATCTSVPTSETAHTFLGLPRTGTDLEDSVALSAADGATHIAVSALPPAEAEALIEHSLGGPVDAATCAWITAKAGHTAGWIAALCAELRRRGHVARPPDAAAHVKETALRKLGDMSWVDISHDLAVRVMEVVDQLSSRHLMMCKIVAAITEQPDVAAFYYSVNRACQVMIGAELDPHDIAYLQTLYLLKECRYHGFSSSAGASTDGGKPDAAIFYIAPMRDVVAGLLTPQQRRDINRVCAESFSQTHSMNHPKQFLVRGRHFLFSGDTAAYASDMEAGWSQIEELGEFTEAEQHELKTQFRQWMGDMRQEHCRAFMQPRDFVVWRVRVRVRSVILKAATDNITRRRCEAALSSLYVPAAAATQPPSPFGSMRSAAEDGIGEGSFAASAGASARRQGGYIAIQAAVRALLSRREALMKLSTVECGNRFAIAADESLHRDSLDCQWSAVAEATLRRRGDALWLACAVRRGETRRRRCTLFAALAHLPFVTRSTLSVQAAVDVLRATAATSDSTADRCLRAASALQRMRRSAPRSAPVAMVQLVDAADEADVLCEMSQAAVEFGTVSPRCYTACLNIFRTLDVARRGVVPWAALGAPGGGRRPATLLDVMRLPASARRAAAYAAEAFIHATHASLPCAARTLRSAKLSDAQSRVARLRLVTSEQLERTADAVEAMDYLPPDVAALLSGIERLLAPARVPSDRAQANAIPPLPRDPQELLSVTFWDVSPPVLELALELHVRRDCASELPSLAVVVLDHLRAWLTGLAEVAWLCVSWDFEASRDWQKHRAAAAPLSPKPPRPGTARTPRPRDRMPMLPRIDQAATPPANARKSLEFRNWKM